MLLFVVIGRLWCSLRVGIILRVFINLVLDNGLVLKEGKTTRDYDITVVLVIVVGGVSVATCASGGNVSMTRDCTPWGSVLSVDVGGHMAYHGYTTVDG